MSSSPPHSNSYDHLIKLLVIGDTYTGKSALVNRIIGERFSDRYTESIGINYKIKTSDVDGFRMRLQVWDTAGIAKLNTVTPAYYDHAFGIVLVYNIADRKTYDNLQGWLQIVQEFTSGHVEIMIVGNKCDLDDYRQVYQAEAKTLASKMGCLYYETSAKLNYNVTPAIAELTRRILANTDLLPMTLPPIPRVDTPPSDKLKSMKKSKSNKLHHRPSGCFLS